jgi:hypothetical protein
MKLTESTLRKIVRKLIREKIWDVDLGYIDDLKPEPPTGEIPPINKTAGARLSPRQLKTILNRHEKWLNQQPGGYQANLENFDLRNASFKKADLTEVSFTGSDLRNADFADALLASTNLDNTDLRGANFLRAMLREVDVRGATFTTEFNSAYSLDYILFDDVHLPYLKANPTFGRIR